MKANNNLSLWVKVIFKSFNLKIFVLKGVNTHSNQYCISDGFSLHSPVHRLLALVFHPLNTSILIIITQLTNSCLSIISCIMIRYYNLSQTMLSVHCNQTYYDFEQIKLESQKSVMVWWVRPHTEWSSYLLLKQFSSESKLF